MIHNWFSKRRQAVLARVGNGASAVEKQWACLMTRLQKSETLTLQELRQLWDHENESFGLGIVHPQQIAAIPLLPTMTVVQPSHIPSTNLLQCLKVARLRSKGLSDIEAMDAGRYGIGDVIIPARTYPSQKLKRDQQYVVINVNFPWLKLDTGAKVNPRQFRKTVWQQETMDVTVGDRLLMGQQSQEVHVVDIDLESNYYILRSRNGKIRRISAQEPQVIDPKHSKNASEYRAQALTVVKLRTSVSGYCSNGWLKTRKLTISLLLAIVLSMIGQRLRSMMLRQPHLAVFLWPPMRVNYNRIMQPITIWHGGKRLNKDLWHQQYNDN